MRTRWLAVIGFLALAACGQHEIHDIRDASPEGCELTCSATTEFCNFVYGNCLGRLPDFICEPRPTSCPSTLDPVCGCDGKIHDSPCEANAAGTDLDQTGNCPLMANHFSCGYKQCRLSDEICMYTPPGFGSPLFACAPISAACRASPSCGCLLANPEGLCVNMCRGTASTGIHTECSSGVR